MADGIQELEAFYEKMLASEKEYLQEKAKIEAQEEARARQKYADNLEKAKSSAQRQDVITQESLRRQKKALAELKEQAQADREAFEILQKSLSDMLSDVADKAEDSFSRIQKAEESLSDKLKKDASQFREITVLGGNEFAGDFTVLADYERDNKVLTEYSRMLEEIRQRGKEALGDDISAFFAEFSKKDVSEGIAAAEALLRASDARFLAYIENWKTYRQTADKFADDFYQADYEALKKSFEQELSTAFDKIPDSFFEDGRLSAIAFGEGFVAEFSRQMEEITRGIAAEISASAPAVTANAVPGNTSYHTSYYLAPSADTISAQLRAISAAEERNKLRGISQESR